VASYTVNRPEALLAGLVMYHYVSGHWTRAAVPVEHGFVADLTGGNMRLIPGTRSVLANVSLFGSTAIEGAILKYGP
jgi:hypothetical protein